MDFMANVLKDEDEVNGLKEEVNKLRDIFNNGLYYDIDGLFFSIREKEVELRIAENKY